MKLYGSIPSPYVRRIRMLLANTEHEFIDLQIYGAGDDRDTLAAKNPTLKIPMLEDGETIIFDSRVIFNYLSTKLNLPALSWEQQNQLTMIDGANDSFVHLLLLARSEIEASDDKLFFTLQNERIDATLTALTADVDSGKFAQWHYPAICLYSLLDWITFRELHTLKGYDSLKAFLENNAQRIEVTATDPRNN